MTDTIIWHVIGTRNNRACEYSAIHHGNRAIVKKNQIGWAVMINGREFGVAGLLQAAQSIAEAELRILKPVAVEWLERASSTAIAHDHIGTLMGHKAVITWAPVENWQIAIDGASFGTGYRTVNGAKDVANKELFRLAAFGAREPEPAIKWNDKRVDDYERAYQHALHLADSIRKRAYPEGEQWKPEGDLSGLITQIDNMIAGLPLRETNAPDPVPQLSADYQALKDAGNAMAAAALKVATEYDGCHRLMLAVAAWATAVANEGGRGNG